MRNPIRVFRRGFAAKEMALVLGCIVLVQGITVAWLLKRTPDSSEDSIPDEVVFMPEQTVARQEVATLSTAATTGPENDVTTSDEPALIQSAPVAEEIRPLQQAGKAKVEVAQAELPAIPVVPVRRMWEQPIAAPALQAVACKSAAKEAAVAQCQADGACQLKPSLGTVLAWTPSLAEASRRALKEDKLIFLIHVSGNFADPGFT